MIKMRENKVKKGKKMVELEEDAEMEGDVGDGRRNGWGDCTEERGGEGRGGGGE